jgi:hypothetical protein
VNILNLLQNKINKHITLLFCRNLEVKLMGYGWLIDFLTSKVTTWIVGLYRDKIITDIQYKYDHYISGLLDTYDLDDILEGKLLRLRA